MPVPPQDQCAAVGVADALRDRREPTDAEQTESAKHNYMGTSRRQTDPWDHASPFGHPEAHHGVNPDGLRLLHDWHD